LALLDEHLANKLLSEADYVKAKNKLYTESAKREFEERKKGIQNAQVIIGALGDFISAAKETELQDVGDNEEAKKEIMKRYADKEFAVKAAQIVASTAVAVMKALEQLGPIAGAIAGVLITATGLMQLGNANAERQRIKGLAEGGGIPVTREQDGRNFNATYGGNRSGLFTKPTVLVAEEGPEYVIPFSGLQNPVISKFVGAIESARQSGSLHSFNYQKAISAGTSVKGFAEGGYTGTVTQTGNIETSNQDMIDLQVMLIKEIQALREDVKTKSDLIRAYITLDNIEEAIETMETVKSDVTIE